MLIFDRRALIDPKPSHAWFESGHHASRQWCASIHQLDECSTQA